MSALNITKDNFNNEVMQSDKPVLIDFWAGWCGPCRMISPVIEELAEELSDVKVCKINVDEQEELAAQFSVMTIPSLVVIDKGKVVSKAVGVQPKSRILSMLRQ